MLRNIFIKEIRDKLNDDFFSDYDFEISQEMTEDPIKNKKSVILTIRYIYQREFSFVATIEKHNSIYLKVIPGSFHLEETDYVNSLEFVYERINQWLKYLYDELASMPLARKIKENSDRINELEQLVLNIPDYDLTENEIKEIFKKLDLLENNFKEELEREHLSKQELALEIERLSKEIKTLKNQATIFTQKNWSKSFYNKMHDWMKRHPNTVKAIMGIAHGMLPNGAKEVIPLSQIESAVSEEIEK